MKRKILSLLLAILLITPAVLSSCGGNGTQQTETTVPDTTATETEPQDDVSYLDICDAEGKCNFLLVRGDNASPDEIAATTALAAALRKTDKNINITTDWKGNPTKSDYEIVIGKTLREDELNYHPDRDLLGKTGYIIRAVGTRIFITGGSPAATLSAAEEFAKMRDSFSSDSFAVRADLNIVRNSNAVFDGITYNGKSLTAFPVVYDGKDPVASAAALSIRKLLFEKAGLLMELDSSGVFEKDAVYLKNNNEKSSVGIVGGAAGMIYIAGNDRAGYYRAVRDWLEAEEKTNAGKTLEIKDGEIFSKDFGEFVTYEEFGAKGDGKTDDQPALKLAHIAANEKKVPVITRDGAKYLIGPAADPIPVITDVDWGVSEIIIDDTNVANTGVEIFQVAHETADVAVKLDKLSAGQTKIDAKFDGKYIVTAYNANKMQFIRYGANQNDGAAMRDIFIVDENGNVDPSTPIVWDFETVTSCSARKIEDTRLTLKDGIITTLANAGRGTAYYYRGIRIYRSNVLVDGLYHNVSGEGADGQPYYGILIFHTAADCEVRNVTFTGHKTYKKIGNAGTSVSMGTYDITVTNCPSFKAENCCQTNDINDSTYWGVFASNYSKNIEFDGCVFSRFDAHCGVCNVTLRNCSFGHQGVNLIGHGEALIENCHFYSQYLVNLRSDYGSTFNGNLTIKNCTYLPKNGAKADPVIINASNPGDHDFGYVCYLPQNILIDGLYIEDKNPSNKSTPPYLFPKVNSSYNSASYKATYPMVLPKSIVIKNLEIASGRELKLSPNTYMFAGVEMQVN